MNDVGWIDFLNKLRAAGMSIQQMQAYAELQRLGDISLPERVEMLKNLRIQLEAHMDELREHLKVIHYKIDFYEQEIAESQKLPEVS
jgi:DNA-binding transcriptional MerR regulator